MDAMIFVVAVAAVAVGLVMLVLLRPRRRKRQVSLDRVMRASARGQQSGPRADPTVALAVRQRALGEQVTAADRFLAAPEAARAPVAQHQAVVRLRRAAHECGETLAVALQAPQAVPEGLLDEAMALTDRLRVAVLAARSAPILTDWKTRQLAEVVRVEALSAGREAAAAREAAPEAIVAKARVR